MANGYAIKCSYWQERCDDGGGIETFISSTFFPNSDGYIAALKTIEILERDKVRWIIYGKREMFPEKIKIIIDKYDLGAELAALRPCSHYL